MPSASIPPYLVLASLIIDLIASCMDGLELVDGACRPAAAAAAGGAGARGAGAGGRRAELDAACKQRHGEHAR